MTPRQRIEAECARRGQDAVVAGCIDLLCGGTADDDLVNVLGGRSVPWVVDRESRVDQRYWLRVWAARGLLWAWNDAALPQLKIALTDDAWRVREMGCKVVARHQLGDALPLVAALREDPVPRVRRAASRAVVLLTAAGA